MIIQLYPEQVAQRWDFISWSIKQALPPTYEPNPDAENNLLAAALEGRLVCWIVYREIEQGVQIVATVVTTELIGLAGEKELLVYALTGTIPLEDEEWLESFRKLQEWAVFRGCDSITAYTQNPIVIAKVKELGGDTSWRYIKLPARGDN